MSSSFTNKHQDTKNIAKAQDVPRDTVESTVCKFKVKGIVVTLGSYQRLQPYFFRKTYELL